MIEGRGGFSCTMKRWSHQLWRHAHYGSYMTAKFKPCAYYLQPLREVIVVTKDCSYTARRVSRWSELLWENYRPWYAFWEKLIGYEKCIGFIVHCPPVLGLVGNVSVATVLERVLQEDSTALGKHKARFFRLAKGLRVTIG